MLIVREVAFLPETNLSGKSENFSYYFKDKSHNLVTLYTVLVWIPYRDAAVAFNGGKLKKYSPQNYGRLNGAMR